MDTYYRQATSAIFPRLQAIRDLVHIIIGPRQVGKTTAAKQLAAMWKGPVIFESADGPLPPDFSWLEAQWNRAVAQPYSLLIIDEVQKIPRWNETIKYLWDTSKAAARPAVLLLGSSALLVQRGLTESLAGRFLLHRFDHWRYPEMRDAFGYTLDEWIFFGGYPGAARFRHDELLWIQYVRDSLVETVITKDVLQLEIVAKPALLRHLFLFSAAYPAQILAYNKMLGQLQDAGNTTTLAHYVHLLESTFLLSGLEQFKNNGPKKRGSSPKLIFWNNALVSAILGIPFKTAREDHKHWGRLVENAVGGTLLAKLQGTPGELFYWRQRDCEVDFVLRHPHKLTAIEVTTAHGESQKGMGAFRKNNPEATPLFIGAAGIPLEEFFSGLHPQLA